MTNQQCEIGFCATTCGHAFGLNSSCRADHAHKSRAYVSDNGQEKEKLGFRFDHLHAID